jgi:hypothetical protein
MQANSKEDEEELLRLLGDLKREFGVPDRYKFEGRPRRERPPAVCPCRVGARARPFSRAGCFDPSCRCRLCYDEVYFLSVASSPGFERK